MKQTSKLLSAVLVLFILVGCQTAPQNGGDVGNESTQNEPVVSPPTPSKLTVNDEEVKLTSQQFLKVGDQLYVESDLIEPTPTFDTMKSTRISNFSGWKIIHTVPSLDTPTCSLQTIQTEDAAKNNPEINFITISADLPFALYRFCGANEIENITVLSDYQSLDFARNNHFLMEGYQLLARSIMVVDPNNVVQYIEYANEVTQQISVTNAVAFLKQNKE